MTLCRVIRQSRGGSALPDTPNDGEPTAPDDQQPNRSGDSGSNPGYGPRDFNEPHPGDLSETKLPKPPHDQTWSFDANRLFRRLFKKNGSKKPAWRCMALMEMPF